VPAAPTGAQLVSEGLTRLGDPYVYGATGPNTFDCSGLTQWLYARVGLKIPRTADAQYTAGTPISRAQLQQGDLVFSAGSDGTTSHPGHVGIYAGTQDGVPMVLEAPHTGANVRLTPLGQFDASAYRRMRGVAGGDVQAGWRVPVPGLGGIDVPSPGDVVGGAEGIAGGLLDVPKDIIAFFSKATDDLAATGKFFWAFTQPATWIRIGAGWLGTLFLIAGLTFLILAGVRE
jgi:hypothetical protein